MKAIYSIAILKQITEGNLRSVSIIMPEHRNVESGFTQMEKK